MKIDIKLTSDELLYLEQKIICVQSMRPQELSIDKRVPYSIMIDVADKIVSKAKNLSRSPKLFDAKSKNKISLKWHEAYCLEEFFEAVTEDETDIYKINMARKISTQLNQKLA